MWFRACRGGGGGVDGFLDFTTRVFGLVEISVS